MSDDFEDTARRRMQALETLESSAGRRRLRGMERIEGLVTPKNSSENPLMPDGGEIFDQDELEANAEFLSQIRTGDQLAAKAALRKQKWHQLNQQAKFSRIQPPSVLKGVIGNVAEVELGSQIQVANWAGDDAESCPITFTLGPVDQVPAELLNNFNPFAICRWGTHGYSLTAEVDIGRGCQFTVAGSAAVLTLVNPTTESALIPGAPTALSLAGMLSLGLPVVRTAPITRTTRILVAGGDTVRVRVPAFAKSVRLVRASALQALTVTCESYDGTTAIYSVAVPAAATFAETLPINEFPLTNNAVELLITAGVGAGTVVWLIFTLDL